MPTLLLLRHAKSSWTESGLRDFDRPLAPRGEEAAALMGAFIAKHDLTPDLVLCSPALRARATLDLALGRLPTEPEVRYADELYLAGPSELIALLRGLERSPGRVMMIGHNPGFQALVLALCAEGDEGDLDAVAHKFPTAALAVIDFETAWGDIAAGLGRLRLFTTPKTLARTATP